MARAIASCPPLKDLLGDEIEPGADILDHGALASWINQTGEHYYHPVGTCKMGVPDDPLAVCDPRGRVHGLDNVYVADCSVMPVIPRANTNIPAVVVGERIGRWLLDSNP